jgi:replicative DNA helicase Mcm
VKDIISIVEEIENEFENGAPIEEVLDTAEEHGTERSKAEHQIDQLKQQGELYEPNPGHLRSI